MGTHVNQSKPEPLFVGPFRPKCPVCGQSVYSLAGIHPQCAQTQADQSRLSAIKAKAKLAEKAVVPADEILSPWHKRCPKCRAKSHVRKLTCTCGFTFPVRPKG